MNQIIDALTARTQFGAIMKKAAENKTRFVVSRRGKPAVVVLGIEDYLKNIVKQSSLVVEIQSAAEKSGLSLMDDAEIEKEIVAARKSKK